MEKKYSRKDLLKEIIRYRFLDIIILSLLLFLFYIPTLFITLFIEGTFFNVPNIFNNLIIYFFDILSFMIMGLGFSGAFYFAKKLCFQEGASIRRDFFDGVFKNLKMSLILFFILGFIYGGIHYLSSAFFEMNVFSPTLEYIILGVLYAFFIIIFISICYTFTQGMIYEDKLSKLFINGIKFSIGNFFKSILVLLLLSPLAILEFFNNEIIIGICFIVLAFFLFGLFIICFTLISHDLFDKTINKKQYPQLIGKGLRKDD